MTARRITAILFAAFIGVIAYVATPDSWWLIARAFVTANVIAGATALLGPMWQREEAAEPEEVQAEEASKPVVVVDRTPRNGDDVGREVPR